MRAQQADEQHYFSQPRFMSAAGHCARLRWVLGAGAVLTVAVLSALWWDLLASWRWVLVAEGASLLMLMATAHALYGLSRWRSEAFAGLSAQAGPLPSQSLNSQDSSSTLRNSLRAWRRGWRRASTVIANQMPVVGLSFYSLLALVLVFLDVPEAASGASEIPAFAVSLTLVSFAFALLVLERYYSGERCQDLPEAVHFSYALRVALGVALVLALGVFLQAPSGSWFAQVLTAVAILPAAVVLEYLLRTLLSVFAPPEREPEFLAESLIASSWRWPFQPLRHFQDQLKLRYGVDLRQSWAFGYIRRALLPVAAVLSALAWVLSGLHEIPVDGRAVYERFGRPVAVWKPGFHLGLPRPFGRARNLEYGVVHELTAAGLESDAAGADTNTAGAEDFAPDSANRLWDASHIAENSQVIASESRSADGVGQSFHIVNMDVRFIYRIGMTDSDALHATYNSTDIGDLIRTSARRILVGYFASRTLEGVLGERRTALATEIGASLQADLDALASGVEIMSTVVEAIHPPAAAANSYHAVQAAQINAQSIIARERGNAAQQSNSAELRASLSRNVATAAARETLAIAEAAKLRFAAEREAYERGGRAFVLERYLAQLSLGFDDAQMVIIDHRLTPTHSTLDLRNFSTPDPSLSGQRADRQELP